MGDLLFKTISTIDESKKFKKEQEKKGIHETTDTKFPEMGYNKIFLCPFTNNEIQEDRVLKVLKESATSNYTWFDVKDDRSNLNRTDALILPLEENKLILSIVGHSGISGQHNYGMLSAANCTYKLNAQQILDYANKLITTMMMTSPVQLKFKAIELCCCVGAGHEIHYANALASNLLRSIDVKQNDILYQLLDKPITCYAYLQPVTSFSPTKVTVLREIEQGVHQLTNEIHDVSTPHLYRCKIKMSIKDGEIKCEESQ